MNQSSNSPWNGGHDIIVGLAGHATVTGIYFSQGAVSGKIGMVSDGILYRGDNQKILCSSDTQKNNMRQSP